MPARLLLTFILCFTVIVLRAQQSDADSKPVYQEIFGAFSLPVGSFANDDEGGAQNGWGIGVQQMRGVGVRNIFLSYCLSYTSQPYKFNGSVFWNEEFKGNYNSVNFLFGMGTRAKEAPATWFINFMGGFNYISIGGDLGFDDALTFGMSLGAGIVIQKNFIAGLKYYYANPTFEHAGQQKISMLHLIAGIEF